MPWKELPMSELRVAFVKVVNVLHYTVTQACREFGISRKTGYKWLRRARQQPQQPLTDQSRRPQASPRRTPVDLEQQILEVRDTYGWGGRKIRAFLRQRGQVVPSRQTVQQVLHRYHRVPRPPEPKPAPLSFERSAPNELWQLDFKGPIEVARQRVFPFAVLDDHSRYLLALQACPDLTMRSAWEVLWQAFDAAGLPDSVLADNAFGTRGQNDLGLSWFESRLVRLNIRPCHGRPYHPQTQGKIERFNGTLQRELWPRIRRDTLSHFQADLTRWRIDVYNPLRPHESLADQPPVQRWRPSRRPRPARLPAVDYAPAAVLRKVMNRGDISYKGYRILVGAGLEGEYVRIEEHDHELAVYYAWKEIRRLPGTALHKECIL
jgi:transposase InsO family protein